jgi:diadenosine tetraphosphate (Ap4A) HIT family hydrolase
MKHISEEDYHAISISDCFICRIVAGDPLVADPQIVYEDEKTIAFLNQFPTQEGYALVCPKRHVERYEEDLTEEEWLHLQRVVQKVSGAIAKATNSMRMYTASLGSPQKNSHLHIHVCPCPKGTPLEKQQGAAMNWGGGEYLDISTERMRKIAKEIREYM